MMAAGEWEAHWRRKPLLHPKDHHELTVRRPYVDWVLKLIEGFDPRGGSLIELGCGTGLIGRELYDIFEMKRATFVDFAAGAVELARSNLAGRNAEVVRADVLGYEPAERFDLVLSVGLVEHFRGHALIRIVRRHAELLRPGGHAVVITPRRGALWPLLRAFNRIQRIREDPPSDEALARLAADAGLEVVRQQVFLLGFLTGLCARRPNPAESR
jgi:SAM-dependent methyltransferase